VDTASNLEEREKAEIVEEDRDRNGVEFQMQKVNAPMMANYAEGNPNEPHPAVAQPAHATHLEGNPPGHRNVPHNTPLNRGRSNPLTRRPTNISIIRNNG